MRILHGSIWRGENFRRDHQNSSQPRLIYPALALAALLLPSIHLSGANYQVLGWNNLGMHCMDSDYSVFTILPPYNTIEAQLIVSGQLVTNGNGYSITYEAVADPDGSINKTSAGKGNWLEYAPLLYGAVAADQGLPVSGPDSFWMPGTNNTPQGMMFESSFNWFSAYGVPITPCDDAGNKNPYPMMRLIARNSGGTPLATNDIVLPVSDEMDCRACHASGTQAAAMPAAGWVWSENQERDYRLNILRKHDESRFQQIGAAYETMLTTNGFNAQGLYRSVVADGQPVLCAKCHLSEALPNTGIADVLSLTAAVHSFHAHVTDPELFVTLDNAVNRAACYRCHPGSTTKCLRGAMGGAIAADGSLEMQCQSCHGNMSHVGRANRIGWLEEPNCQQCHTGTATSNNGQIRYTSCFTNTNLWIERIAVNQTFATKSNTPLPDISLYRFSAGHGGLQCSACHGSTHAEFPATHRNDNIRNEKIQGHAGVMVECTSCHASMAVNNSTARGGPHGMHPVGSSWVSGHHDFIGGVANCQVCHGVDYRGTALSRAQASRTISVSLDGTSVSFPVYRGAEIGCYNCHNGPFQSSPSPASNPVVSDIATNTMNDVPLTFALPVVGTGAVARALSQPEHGTVGVSNNVAAYFPEAGFVGTDRFAFAAYNGSKNSLLATGTVTVAQGAFGLGAKALVPPSYPAEWPVPFLVLATPVNIVATPTYAWDFGDGSALSTSQSPTHAYAAGAYNWSVTATVQSGAMTVATNLTGTILIGDAVTLAATPVGESIQLIWPATMADALIEASPVLGPGAYWTVAPEVVVQNGGNLSITVSNVANRFFRLRKL